MYSTRGINAIASITELRSKTAELLDKAREIDSGVLIQKNNEPFAVLLAHETYVKLMDSYEKSQKGRK